MENSPAYTAILSVRAEKEIYTSFDWYEDQQKGLGDRFISVVLQRIHSIELNPELFPSKHRSYRETTTAPFPFVIIYRINKRKKTIRVVSVFHTSQNPKKKYD